MRELNRLGVTSAIDAGGGGQNYPDDYAVVRKVHAADQATVRIAYNLFAQKPSEEHADYERWVHAAHRGQGDDMLRLLGAGENPRLGLRRTSKTSSSPGRRWRTRWEARPRVRRAGARRAPLAASASATYDESIRRFLDVFEKVRP